MNLSCSASAGFTLGFYLFFWVYGPHLVSGDTSYFAFDETVGQKNLIPNNSINSRTKQKNKEEKYTGKEWELRRTWL